MLHSTLRRTIGVCALLFSATSLHATTYNSPIVDDGVLPALDGTGDNSWAADELLVDDQGDGEPWGPFNVLDGFWVTWDANGIYFSVIGKIWDTPTGIGGNAVNLYIDSDFGQGTGPSDMSAIDPAALGAVSRNISRTFTVDGGFGVDWGYTTWAGRFDLGFLDLSDPALPVNLFEGITDGQSVATHTSPEGVIESRDLLGNGGYELFIPWTVLYPALPAGQVPAGTQMAIVVAQMGGGDSLSPESIPDELGDRNLSESVVFTVDADGDGIPDLDWPPSGSIAGTVTLSDPTDLTSQVDVLGFLDGVRVAKATTPAGGGAYLLPRLGPGTYTVSLESPIYVADDRTVVLAEGEDRTGVDIAATKVNSGVDLSFRFTDGPEALARSLDVHYRLERVTDSRVFAEATLGVGDALSLRVAPIPPGNYRLLAWTESLDPLVLRRTGYRPLDLDLDIVADQYLDPGSLDFSLVQPTRIAFATPESIADDLVTVTATGVSASLPAEGFFARRNLMIVLLDDVGNEALITPALRGSVSLAATDIDPRQPAAGAVQYWTFSGDTTPVALAGDNPSLSVVDPVAIVPTRAMLRISSDTTQVLRLRAAEPTLGFADLEIKVTPRLPAAIRMTPSRRTAIAGEEITLDLQLLDVSGDASQSSDILIRFEVDDSGVDPLLRGLATVNPSQVLSRTDGSASVTLQSPAAGVLRLRAMGFVQQDTIYSPVDSLTLSPDLSDHVALVARQSSSSRLEVEARLVDQFGNTVTDDPRTLGFSAAPAELVSAAPSSVSLDATGIAQLDVTLLANRGGIVTLSASDPTLPVTTSTAAIEVRPGLIASDEAAPESDDAHNSNPSIDLTNVFATVVRDTLEISIPFVSDFNGAHIALLLEVNGDAGGAFNDPFTFPISYAHSLLPDYVLTYKYAADDYGDLRRQAGPPGSWEWYNFRTQSWASGFEEGVNAKVEGMMGKTLDSVFFRIPIRGLKSDFVAGMDTVRVETYVMQEDGEKRPALDSSPADATVDMIPPSGNWFDSSNLIPTTLSQWAAMVPVEIGTSLRILDASFSPTVSTQGDLVLIQAQPGFEGATPSNANLQVFADLTTNFGGDALTPMFDDGSHGDALAGDGIYSTQITVPASLLAGDYSVTLRVIDVASSQQAFGRATLTVEGEPELTPLVVITDPAGDDHGPNRPGEQFLFYEYPTSGVFFDGVFDLRRLEIFDVGDRLLFRVQITDLTNPAEPGASDWNAIYPSDDTCPAGSRIDLNLQNVVILLDTKDGNNVGSSNLPDNRRAGVAGQDAWEYALVYDGWWKGVVRSNGSSQQGLWETLPNDSDWFFCANDQTNTIDGFLNKEVFASGDLDNIQEWDITVLMSGHDGNSDKNNWGAVRWVNEGIAEWQFGGGRNGEGTSDRDPNVVDIMTLAGISPTGEPKPPGRPQEEQMNFLTAAARARFALGQPAVLFEATEFVDDVPPSVQWMGITPDRGIIPWAVLQDSPVVVRSRLVDAAGVEKATLFWRAPGEAPSQARAVPMGQLRGDIDEGGSEWVADLRWEEIAAATDTGPLSDPAGLSDRVRYIYVSIEATDKVGNTTATGSERVEEALELPVDPITDIHYPSIDRQTGTDFLEVDLNEGSQLRIPRSVVTSLAPDSSQWQLDLDLRAVPANELDFSFTGNLSESIVRRDDRFLGMVRELKLSTFDAVTGDRQVVDRFPEPVELSLHFPRYLLGDDKPSELQFFRWNERTRRWILVGAHGERSGTTVTARLDRLGTYAVFSRPGNVELDKAVTGLQLSPNPFSPNGDGLYDDLNISYVLPGDTESAIVEIFDRRGTRLKILTFFVGDGVTNRTLGLTWDGRDESGNYVPRGIYVVRVEVRDSQDNRVERATKAVAVIR